VEYEQYLDFLRNRMFRRSLLCRADVTIDRNFNPKPVEKLYVASSAVAQTNVSPNSAEEAKFRVDDGILTSAAPLLKNMLAILGERWPEPLHFDELRNTLFTRLASGPAAVASPQDLVNPLASNLVHCFIRSIVELYEWPPPAQRDAGEFPHASRLARLQATTQSEVTTCLHHSVGLNAVSRKVLSLADGSRDRVQLRQGLVQAVRDGQLVFVQGDGPHPDAAAVEQLLDAALDKSLRELARLGVWCKPDESGNRLS
jgi:methyltransferase-like protein